MAWPSRSPDLNPIENLWGWLARRVYRNGRQFNDADQLFAAIQQEWAIVPEADLKNLIDSMTRRLTAVLRANGGPTRY